MKKLIGIGFVLSIFLINTGQAEGENNISFPKLNLVFEDRILTLDFEAQPNLLEQKAEHFLAFRNSKMPMDFQGDLPIKTPFLKIETRFKTQISAKVLHEFLENSFFLKEEDTPPVKIDMDAQGVVTFDGEPQNGYEVNEPLLLKLLNLALEKNYTHVRAPAKKVFSEVIISQKLQDMGIKEITSVGESNFSGSPKGRRQNIAAASKKFNGVIIPKGEVFSFNKILKSVDRADGFVEEFVIKGNKSFKEMGGGTCQVSTTIFRAAFSGGFPIVKRSPHSYAVPYYKPFGLDAAIYLGSVDFQFLNDSPSNLLVQVFIKEDNMSFVFYGTSDGRKVEMKGPFLSGYRKPPAPIMMETDTIPEGKTRVYAGSHDGFRAEWTRIIKKSDTPEPIEEKLVSNYRAWAAQVWKGVSKEKLAKKDEGVANTEAVAPEVPADKQELPTPIRRRRP